MCYIIIVMPGEGVGPEVVREGQRVLDAVSQTHNIPLETHTFEVGRAALAKCGEYLPPEARRACDRASESGRGAILFGSVEDEPIGMLRKDYDLFANLRPVHASTALLDVSPLRPEVVRGTDMLIVRELVSDIYYGKAHSGVSEGRWASQEMYYAEHEIERIVRVALEAARTRRKSLTLVHKGNVIKGVYALWKDVLHREHSLFPDVRLSEMLVDAMAMQMVLQPTQYDVLLCSNLFGDILSDIGGAIVGSVGLLPSASLNASGFALYECVGGTAPDIAGQEKANPTGTILSVAMMCRYTFKNVRAAETIERAVEKVFETHRTSDIACGNCSTVTTREIGDRIVAEIRRSM